MKKRKPLCIVGYAVGVKIPKNTVCHRNKTGPKHPMAHVPLIENRKCFEDEAKGTTNPSCDHPKDVENPKDENTCACPTGDCIFPVDDTKESTSKNECDLVNVIGSISHTVTNHGGRDETAKVAKKTADSGAKSEDTIEKSTSENPHIPDRFDFDPTTRLSGEHCTLNHSTR